MEVTSSIEKLVINSLLLLGYEAFEVPKDMKIVLDADLFKKSNPKALDSILYFLFGKLAPNALGCFIFSWPPRTPEQKREFKEEAYKLIIKLEQEGKLFENTLLGKSVLDGAQGERAWALLKSLTDATMRLEIEGIQIPFYPNLQNWLQNPAVVLRSSVNRMKKSMICHLRAFAERFNKTAAVLVGKQEQWADFARFLTQEHKDLRNAYDSLIGKKSKTDSNSEILEKLAALDRVPQIDMLRYIWKNIEFLQKASSDRHGEEKVTQLIAGSSNSRSIYGDVEGNLQNWSASLSSLSSNLEKSESNSIQCFITQLKSMLSTYKSKQAEELQEIQSHKSCLQLELSRLTTLTNNNSLP